MLAKSALLDQPQPMMEDQAVISALTIKFLLEESVSASKVSPTTQPMSAPLALHSPMDSSSMEFVQFAQEV